MVIKSTKELKKIEQNRKKRREQQKKKKNKKTEKNWAGSKEFYKEQNQHKDLESYFN